MSDEVLILPSLDEIDSELCKKDFFYFLQCFWSEIIAEDPVYNWHIEYLCIQLQEYGERVVRREAKEADFIINIPPGTSKSTICTVMFPAWIWTIDPSIRVLTASYSASLSTDHAVKSRDIIKCARYQKWFPNVAIKNDQDNKTHYKNTKGGERYATSVGGTVTGFHAHLIIVDDPINPKGATSEVLLEAASSFMNTTLSTRKVNKAVTPIILVMQRLHEEDPTGNWLKKKSKKLRHVCLPGKLSKDVRPLELQEKYIDGMLDPVRLSIEVMDEQKEDLGSYGFAGQIQQIPAPEDGGIWKKWFKVIPDHIWNRDILPNLVNVGSDWDLAYTEKESNSACAYVKSGKVDENMAIDDIGFKWLEFPDLINYMKAKEAPHYIEAKASGKSAKQTLKKSEIPAIEVKVSGTEGDKVARTRLATPYAESGMILIRESLVDMLYNDDRQGILKFPNNSHNDLNDALVQAINRHFINNKRKREVYNN